MGLEHVKVVRFGCDEECVAQAFMRTDDEETATRLIVAQGWSVVDGRVRCLLHTAHPPVGPTLSQGTLDGTA